MGNSFFLIVAGLLLFYVVISDKYFCVEGCLACLAGKTPNVSGQIGATITPTVSPVQGIGSVSNILGK